MTKKDIEKLREQYPAEITKEQLYRICHISKRTASVLLDYSVIPCRNTHKKTRKYKILLSDVVKYLERQDNIPIRNKYCIFLDILNANPSKRIQVKEHLIMLWQHFSDVLNVSDIINIIGYSKTSVVSWCKKGIIKSFDINRSLKIPKEYLADFLVSETAFCMRKKSEKHTYFCDAVLKNALLNNEQENLSYE